MKPVLAVDVGGVLASKQHDGEPVTGSFEAIQRLSEKYEIWIVSQCGKARARGTKKWLYQHGFDKYIPESRQIYIPFSEPNKNRVLEDLAPEVFVDDRWKHIKPACDIDGLMCVHLGEEPALAKKLTFMDSLPKNYVWADGWLVAEAWINNHYALQVGKRGE